MPAPMPVPTPGMTPGMQPRPEMPNQMPMNGMSKAALMRQICIADFVILDLNLYLDTHPMDQNALAMYHEQNNKLRMLRAQYANTYGPLNIFEVQDKNAWTWVRDPWPWEGSEM